MNRSPHKIMLMVCLCLLANTAGGRYKDLRVFGTVIRIVVQEVRHMFVI